MKKNADRFVHAIFCDDMRQEMGNKVSLMGCYQGELFVPFAPVALPKLCVFVTVSTPIERPLKALTIRVDQGGTTILNIETPNSDWAQSAPPANEDTTRLLANVGVMLSPLAIAEPGDIRVVVTTEEGEMLGPRLRIKVMPPTDVAADGVTATPTDKAKPKTTAKRAAAKRAPVKRA
jgi:hypothetical protein